MAYATIEDLQDAGLPPGALSSVDDLTKQRALAMASAKADGYLRTQGYLPLAEPYDPSLVQAVVQIAASWLMRRRGFNPHDPGDAAIQLGHDEALEWLKRVANGQVELAMVQALPSYAEPLMVSDASRGYGGSSSVGPNDGGL